ITATLLTQTADRRVEFAQALRAWTRQNGQDVSEAPPASRFVRTAASTVLGVVGAGTLVLGATFFLSSASALGIRCSSNGAYFQETFGTPPQQGCAILRVSAGAEKAGIRQGDLMIEMNGIPITSGTQFSIV